MIHNLLNTRRIGEQSWQFTAVHRFVEQQCGDMRDSFEIAPLAGGTKQLPYRHVEMAAGPVEQRHVETGERLPVRDAVA